MNTIQEYLGDGVYINCNKEFAGQIIITANHHEPSAATDQVHIDGQMGVTALAYALRRAGFSLGNDPHEDGEMNCPFCGGDR